MCEAGVLQGNGGIDAKAGRLLFAVEAVGGAPVSPLGGNVQIEAAAVGVLAFARVAAFGICQFAHFSALLVFFAGILKSTNRNANKNVGMRWFPLIAVEGWKWA